MIDNLMETGIHRLHLSNDMSVTFMAAKEAVLVMRSGAQNIEAGVTLPDVIRDYSKAWAMVHVHVVGRLASSFKEHAWGQLTQLEDVMCELQMFRSRTIMYGLEEIDGEEHVQWYVRLNRPVTEIEGALGEDGQPTDALIGLVCQPLWNMGLHGQTPLSAYSPTGQMCTSFGFYVFGRRVIVSNRNYRDV